MDETESLRLKEVSSGEHSQAPRSTGETTNLRTNESSQPNKPIPSDHRQKYDVFLSHSGKQKNFFRQLHRDLTNQGVSCFFDEDRESLPVGENFPPRIFEAAKTCKAAVLLLSKDFLESKWPMLELSAFVEARDGTRTNPDLKILPLFFRISPDDLKNITADNEKWKQLGMSGEKRAEWHQALNKIRPINGLKFSEIDNNELKFRDEIVKEIWHILPSPSPRYHVRCMQGEERMCQEVARFFNTVHPNEKGIRIAGLYGIPGHGKTTLGKAFCNFQLGDFEGKVCHLEFSRGDSFERMKLALQYLTHCPQSRLQSLTSEDQAQIQFKERVRDLRVLLVLDNITDKNIDIVSYQELAYYLQATMGKNSCILLTARSVDVLKYFNIDSQSCMRVPRLEEDEAIRILLGMTSPGVSPLGAEENRFALKCANRCLFKETSCDIGRRARTFHPLALKVFGRYLLNKYGCDLSKWAAEVDGMADGSGDGLNEVFAMLGKAFDDMDPTYQTIFILLTVYMLPKMSPHKVTQWLGIICNKETNYIQKAVKDLKKKAFIESFEPELRIHDLYIEFAQRKAKEMRRWLWWKGDGSSLCEFYSENEAGFELARLEHCNHRDPSMIDDVHVRYLRVLQVVGVQTTMRNLGFSSMKKIRSVTISNCKDLEVLEGMEDLRYLGWLQISEVNPKLKLPKLISLRALRHLEIDIAASQVINQLGDLTSCIHLIEINVRCPSLSEFPRIDGLQYLEKVEFSMCDKVEGPLNCTNCVMLQSVVLNFCSRATLPLLAGCKKLSKIVLDCDAMTACPVIDAPSALETLELRISSEAALAPKNLDCCDGLKNLQLWNMRKLMMLPSFRRLSNLTVLKLVECDIREPPNLTSCGMLEEVDFFSLKCLKRFPDFSLLKKLKKLYLCNCVIVRSPPNIGGCHELQVFHLLYNDRMKGLPKMDGCPLLDEIKLSWHSEDEVIYEGFDPDYFEGDDDLQSCLEHFKDEIFWNLSDTVFPEALKEWQWLKGKTMLVKRYFRGVKPYYSITAPYPSYKRRRLPRPAMPESIILRIVSGKIVPLCTQTMVHTCWEQTVRKYLIRKRDFVRASASGRGDRQIPGRHITIDLKNTMATHLERLPALGEAMFRDKIMRGISRLLPQRYHVPAMQGEARMCQKVADFFNTVHPNRKGIHIAGLYGMPGLGKTTLGKAFCNFNMGNFDGKVCHLDFSRGCSFERMNFAQGSRWDYCAANGEFWRIVKGQRILLVLDITEKSIGEVEYYLGRDMGKNSCILLIARTLNVLVRNFDIDSKSCMSMPGLEKEEAIAILLEKTSLTESELGAENRGLALQCANRCSFKGTGCDIVGGAHTFHPLALKTFGGHLCSKYRSDLSKWVAEVDGLVVGSGDALDDVFTVLDKAFDDMDPKYRTIFMLLTVYMPPFMSSHKVTEWLAINCKEEIEYTEKAVDDLWQKAFIEHIEPEIQIHDLYMEFAQSKAREMGRWLWCKHGLATSEADAGLFSKDEAGFELVKLEYCQHLDLSLIGDKYVKNVWTLQVVDPRKEKRTLEFSSMKNIRSVTLHNCIDLTVLRGMESLPYLAWLQIRQAPNLIHLQLSSLTALQHLEIDNEYCGWPTKLGDLTGCVSLREIYVRCPELSEFPRIHGLPYLEKAKFERCHKVIGRLDCRACVKLRSIVFEDCSQMAHIPLIDGCSNLSKIVLNRCDKVTMSFYRHKSSALEILELCISSADASAPRHSACCDRLKNIPLWNIMMRGDNTWSNPRLSLFSNLTVLKLYKCEMREPPDVTCCSMLEDVYFFTLKYLESFPDFSSLRKLKKLCLCNCKRVRAPPDIGGCHELQVFHLLYNDNMKGLPKMDGCPLLEEIKLSWRSEEVVPYYFHSNEDDDDLEFCPYYQKEEIFENLNDVFMPVEVKEWQWMQGKTVQVKQYFRGQKQYVRYFRGEKQYFRGRKCYSITAPYDGSGEWEQASNAGNLHQVITHRASAISDEDEWIFRDKATIAICRLLPTEIRSTYSAMQQESTLIWPRNSLFSTVKGVHVAGLYEEADTKKTIICESFYNFSLERFEGDVSSLEFAVGNSMERLNNALKYLTRSPGLEMTPLTSEFLDQDAFSKGPTFNIMILLIRHPIPNNFMEDNFVHIARDFHVNWGVNTRIVFRSQRHIIIEFGRHESDKGSVCFMKH